MNSKIRFLGAAGTVTGSKTLVEHGGTRYLVDCGLFQGLKELRIKNWSGFPVKPKSIKSLLLTHAHLDHCGYIPLLVKKGFTGEIHCTEPTESLAEIILKDSANPIDFNSGDRTFDKFVDFCMSHLKKEVGQRKKKLNEQTGMDIQNIIQPNPYIRWAMFPVRYLFFPFINIMNG